MFQRDDEFDLDVRFWGASAEVLDLRAPARPGAAILRGEGQPNQETEAPQATCPADTCGLDCQTQTCPEATCGCDTSETCDQHLPACSLGPDAITFGPYCEDQSDDTCHACPEPNTPGCPDPPD